ncbi:NAD(P)-dependent oxidoreductase [Mucilaginibacter rubeus]|uniref:NAD(P)-dependent oxidoreductase n=1 Tax=Mucilaginibacter rubeus TaxID=2027860 RepID=A0AAE6MKM0_9SPHI|nr:MULTISPECIES: NAD(P)-dependent oxidoreductase [Mucilaginibacter]QEM06397.1 NAD(P)-dependent oxidoreductase [Mucilaginibacter rubeus]QEM18980.1 NAD(P)-dependent oxidoreductase [Mucilaginibacter gossypii]QTE44478.1 NAD(P)-dependent oxidoreductase [Mucilaginibacter rubeus]QTE51076.1 NAD(P)-dependent oxidoreductase [Mucilaginibacter rubeus]QTE56162.1 NAD(P)-dependent oxidoreductase [Mucilaginibacter rubeus]
MLVLVTGSSGRLGAVTVKHLRAHGHNVIGIDLIAAETTDEQIDILNKDAVLAIAKNTDAIIHTAAIHGKHYELNYPREAFIDVNIYGTLNLLNACIANGVQKMLYTSTTSIYGDAMVDANQAVWVDEELPIKPRDIYDITKQTAEQLCKDFFYREGLQTSVYRVGRFLPETDNLKLNHRLYRGLDERDGAEGLQLALEQTFPEFEIFNITSSSPFKKDELVQLKQNPAEVIIKHYPQAKAIYELNGWTFPKSIDRVYVSNKAKRYFGYEPKFTFDYVLNNLEL